MTNATGTIASTLPTSIPSISTSMITSVQGSTISIYENKYIISFNGLLFMENNTFLIFLDYEMCVTEESTAAVSVTATDFGNYFFLCR